MVLSGKLNRAVFFMLQEGISIILNSIGSWTGLLYPVVRCDAVNLHSALRQMTVRYSVHAS